MLFEFQPPETGPGPGGHPAKDHRVLPDPVEPEPVPGHLVQALPEGGARVLQAEQRIPDERQGLEPVRAEARQAAGLRGQVGLRPKNCRRGKIWVRIPPSVELNIYISSF